MRVKVYNVPAQQAIAQRKEPIFEGEVFVSVSAASGQVFFCIATENGTFEEFPASYCQQVKTVGKTK